MLARETRLVYICLQCRRNLRPATLYSSRVATNTFPGRVQRRWQSAATGRVAHEDIDHGPDDDTTPDLKPKPDSKHEAPAHYRGEFPFWRTWKPKPTAALGVSSLGKPAEVLLLPSRDRIITQVPRDDGRERAGTTLQESLDSEKVPLSGAKLAENIEQIRSLVGKMRGQLERHEWRTIKRHLRSGFQKSQLEKYLRLQKTKQLSLPGLRNNLGKEDLIKYLVEEVWGFTAPVGEDSAAPPAKKGKKIKLSFNLRDSAKLEHMLTHQSQPLKEIAESLDVQIDVSLLSRNIRAFGHRHDANQALQRVARYARDLGTIVVQLQGRLGTIYRDPKLRDHLVSYLESLQRKYRELNIALDKHKISIVHRNSERVAEQARREILLSVPSNADTLDSTVWPSSEKSETILQSFPTPSELPVTLQQYQWLRLISTDAMAQSAASVDRRNSFNQSLQDLQDAFRGAPLIGTTTSRQGLYHDFTASIGQVLVQEHAQSVDPGSAEPSSSRDEDDEEFDPENDVEDTEVNAEITARLDALSDAGQKVTSDSSLKWKARQNTHWESGAPFLAHHLTTLDPWLPRHSEQPQEINENARAILRLELSPTAMSNPHSAPIFEIFLVTNEESGRERPRLQIARVSAIHKEVRFGVLCPWNEVDLKFTRQLKQDLVFPGMKETELNQNWMTKWMNCLRSLRGYINRSQSTGSSDWVFPPFVDLPINQAPGDTSENTVPIATTSKPDQLEAGSPGMTEKRVEYLLCTVDIVDVDSRLISVRSPQKLPNSNQSQSRVDFSLDHITYTGSDVTKKELRLSQSPMLYPPTLQLPHLSTFLRAALSVVERLSGNPLKPGHKLDSFLPETDEYDIETGDSLSKSRIRPSSEDKKEKPSAKVKPGHNDSLPPSAVDGAQHKSLRSRNQPSSKTEKEKLSKNIKPRQDSSPPSGVNDAQAKLLKARNQPDSGKKKKVSKKVKAKQENVLPEIGDIKAEETSPELTDKPSMEKKAETSFKKAEARQDNPLTEGAAEPRAEKNGSETTRQSGSKQEKKKPLKTAKREQESILPKSIAEDVKAAEKPPESTDQSILKKKKNASKRAKAKQESLLRESTGVKAEEKSPESTEQSSLKKQQPLEMPETMQESAPPERTANVKAKEKSIESTDQPSLKKQQPLKKPPPPPKRTADVKAKGKSPQSTSQPSLEDKEDQPSIQPKAEEGLAIIKIYQSKHAKKKAKAEAKAAEAMTTAVAKAKAEFEAQVAKAQAEFEAKAKAKPQPSAKAEPEGHVAAKAKAKTEREAKPKSQPQTKVKEPWQIKAEARTKNKRRRTKTTVLQDGS